MAHKNDQYKIDYEKISQMSLKELVEGAAKNIQEMLIIARASKKMESEHESNEEQKIIH